MAIGSAPDAAVIITADEAVKTSSNVAGTAVSGIGAALGTLVVGAGTT